MTDKPDLSTLPQRMRYAAPMLREADERYGSKHSWSPAGLEIYADKWEAEDRAAAERDAERDAQVEQLAREMFDANSQEHGRQWDDPYEVVHGAYMAIARALIESGWRKGDPA